MKYNSLFCVERNSSKILECFSRQIWAQMQECWSVGILRSRCICIWQRFCFVHQSNRFPLRSICKPHKASPCLLSLPAPAGKILGSNAFISPSIASLPQEIDRTGCQLQLWPTKAWPRQDYSVFSSAGNNAWKISFDVCL